MRNQIFLSLILSVYFVFTASAQDAPADNNKSVMSSSSAAVPDAQKSEYKPTQNLKDIKVLPSDVRVLIDVSGSMKQTDPHNLRKPALDLIVRLLPDKSRAGVWTFGNSVNMLVPFQTVDGLWRKQAAPKANKINSVAMFTNIGKALEEVSFDKKTLSADYKTHIILLTDGVVDIGQDAVRNNKERQRILNDILPSLKSAGYKIHTIALSSDADVDLLKKISVATDGIFATATSADQLMSVFLKIFDQAVPSERVPLENNGFLVDASIKEFTALIFRKQGEDKTIIVSPEGKEYSSTNPNDNINWYRTDQYDLITAEDPKTGQWKIKTDVAPQSRITVVSNLQLVVETLKNNLHSNDSLALAYSFQENGKTITDKNFLSLIDVNAIVSKLNTNENVSVSFAQDSLPIDGVFHKTLNNFSTIGDYEIHIFVDGKTFKREFKHSLTVRDGLMILLKSSVVGDAGRTTYNYQISSDEKIVDVSTVHVNAEIKNESGIVEKEFNKVNENHWAFSFTPEQDGNYTIDVHALGRLLDGSKLDETLHADNFHYAAVKLKTSSSVTAASADGDKKNSAIKPDKSSNNFLFYTGLILGNLLLILLGYFAYKFIMGTKAKDELVEFEKTLAEANATGIGDSPLNVVPASLGKTEIDLSDEDPENIPMNNNESAFDLLIPLDGMDDIPENDK